MEQLDLWLSGFAAANGLSGFVVRGVPAVLLVGLTCGLVGSLVVGNRMAFFSDAMAHTAFAGVAVSLLSVIVATGARQGRDLDPYLWLVPLGSAAVGVLAAVAMTYVRDRANLTTDTAIGVFFALSIGVGAMLLPQLPRGTDPDQFLFGSVTFVSAADLVTLAALAVTTAVLVPWKYNAWVLASVNPNLARSRGVPVTLNNYLFVILLAVVVNLCVRTVGVLLINAMLVVPAAAAANLAGNLRQFFWLTVAISVGSGLVGYDLHRRVTLPVKGGDPIEFGPTGMIVVVCVACFFVTMPFGAVRRRLRVLRPGESTAFGHVCTPGEAEHP